MLDPEKNQEALTSGGKETGEVCRAQLWRTLWIMLGVWILEVFKECIIRTVLKKKNKSKSNAITGLRGHPLVWLDDHFTFKASLIRKRVGFDRETGFSVCGKKIKVGYPSKHTPKILKSSAEVCKISPWNTILRNHSPNEEKKKNNKLFSL